MEKSVKGIPYLENVKKGVFRGVFIFYGESFMEGGKRLRGAYNGNKMYTGYEIVRSRRF